MEYHALKLDPDIALYCMEFIFHSFLYLNCYYIMLMVIHVNLGLCFSLKLSTCIFRFASLCGLTYTVKFAIAPAGSKCTLSTGTGGPGGTGLRQIKDAGGRIRRLGLGSTGPALGLRFRIETLFSVRECGARGAGLVY